MRLVELGKAGRAQGRSRHPRRPGQQRDRVGHRIDLPYNVVAGVAEGNGAITEQGNSLELYSRMGDREEGIGCAGVELLNCAALLSHKHVSKVVHRQSGRQGQSGRIGSEQIS